MRRCLYIFFIVCSLATFAAGAGRAARAYREGRKAERAGDRLKAYFLYAQAAQADGKNPKYAAKMAELARNAALRPRTELARDPADETTPAQLEAEGLISDTSLDLPQAAPPPRFAASGARRSFTLKGSAREMFEQVAGAYGVHLLFEADYRDPPPFTFTITDVGFKDALRTLEAATDSFVIPINATTGLVARDTTQKRTQLTPAGAIAVPIPERISVQEAQEIATAVQQTLEIRKISLDAARRLVYFRDVVSKLYAAREMFGRLSRLRAQITVDCQFLSVSTTSSLAYGLSLPTSSAIVDFGTLPASLSASIPPGSPSGFAAVGGGKSLLGIGIGNSTALATLGQSSTTALLDSQIVALDGQAATLRVGDRYPITTASYSGVNGAPVQGGGTIPTINYVDLGLGLKITPTVNEDGEVTLDIEAEYKSLGPTDANGNPSINNQQFQGKVRLEEGEWAVVAGLVQITRTKNPTGIAGLSSIPILGNLFRSQTPQNNYNEILLVLKPHLSAQAPWQDATGEPIWTGTETRPVTVF